MLGLLGLVFVSAFAISHYVFGMPVYEAHSRSLASPSLIARTLFMLLGGSCLFAALGGWMLLRFFRSKK